MDIKYLLEQALAALETDADKANAINNAVFFIKQAMEVKRGADMSANIKALLGQADNDPEKFAVLLLGETLRVLKLAYGEGNEAFHTYDEALEHAESNIRDHFEIPEDIS